MILNNLVERGRRCRRRCFYLLEDWLNYWCCCPMIWSRVIWPKPRSRVFWTLWIYRRTVHTSIIWYVEVGVRISRISNSWHESFPCGFCCTGRHLLLVLACIFQTTIADAVRSGYFQFPYRRHSYACYLELSRGARILEFSRFDNLPYRHHPKILAGGFGAASIQPGIVMIFFNAAYSPILLFTLCNSSPPFSLSPLHLYCAYFVSSVNIVMAMIVLKPAP